MTETESIVRVATAKIRLAVESVAPPTGDPYWKTGREWACVVVHDVENGRWCKQIEEALKLRVPKRIIVKCLSTEYTPLLLGLRLRHAFQIGEGEISTALRMVVNSKLMIDAPKPWTMIEL